jgi:hypothetical protein
MLPILGSKISKLLHLVLLRDSIQKLEKLFERPPGFA